ncbi:MAG: UvrD-helicase domain-containing protein, partial [Planctomycetota bacterium]
MTRLDPETADLDGLTVIEASAGTGKTYAVQKIVARLVCEGLPVQRLLAMSYTNTAADELAERIRRELEAALAKVPADDPCVRGRLERALADLDLAQVSTIHAFCQRMLTEHPVEAGVHGLEGWTLETDGSAETRRCCDEAWSALVEEDAALDLLLTEPGEVRSAVRGADANERVRAEVMSADLPGAVHALVDAVER